MDDNYKNEARVDVCSGTGSPQLAVLCVVFVVVEFLKIYFNCTCDYYISPTMESCQCFDVRMLGISSTAQSIGGKDSPIDFTHMYQSLMQNIITLRYF